LRNLRTLCLVSRGVVEVRTPDLEEALRFQGWAFRSIRDRYLTSMAPETSREPRMGWKAHIPSLWRFQSPDWHGWMGLLQLTEGREEVGLYHAFAGSDSCKGRLLFRVSNLPTYGRREKPVAHCASPAAGLAHGFSIRLPVYADRGSGSGGKYLQSD